MIWPADYFWVHAVDEIQSGTRYSVNCFLRATPEYYPEHVRFGVPIPVDLKNTAWDGNRAPIQYSSIIISSVRRKGTNYTLAFKGEQ